MLFSFFSKFCFSGLLGGGEVKVKNDPKWQKKIFLALYLRNCTSYDCGFCYTCKMMISPAIFFPFFKILIFWVFQSSSINARKEMLRCVPPSSHMCDFFYFNLQKCMGPSFFRILLVTHVWIKRAQNLKTIFIEKFNHLSSIEIILNEISCNYCFPLEDSYLGKFLLAQYAHDQSNWRIFQTPNLK